jgi:ubiquitin thioesterase protein OTUB1
MQGPLVGEKKSSHAIAEEYAKADPIYVAKTAVSTPPNTNSTLF